MRVAGVDASFQPPPRVIEPCSIFDLKSRITGCSGARKAMSLGSMGCVDRFRMVLDAAEKKLKIQENRCTSTG
jgi:hypothetical protein